MPTVFFSAIALAATVIFFGMTNILIIWEILRFNQVCSPLWQAASKPRGPETSRLTYSISYAMAVQMRGKIVLNHWTADI